MSTMGSMAVLMRWVEFGGDGGVGWMVSSWLRVDSAAIEVSCSGGEIKLMLCTWPYRCRFSCSACKNTVGWLDGGADEVGGVWWPPRRFRVLIMVGGRLGLSWCMMMHHGLSVGLLVLGCGWLDGCGFAE